MKFLRISLPVVALTLAATTISAYARYARVDTEEVPLERLLTNLTAKAKESPDDSNVLHQLARTHAMAFANKLGDADPVTAWAGRGPAAFQSLWFGYQPPHVPYHKVAGSDDAEKVNAAKAHLAAAIDAYKKALEAKPEDRAATTIKLGLAWCQDQAGEKEAAVAGYRAVAATAWETESKRRGGLGNFVYVETAGYLIPLLNATEDAAEIAELEAGKKKLLSLPRMVTPVIVPLGKSTELNALVDRDARVRFDLDASGRQLEWPWITKDAAWLVFDPSNSGKITSSIQMFGSHSFLLFCTDGYEALALLDDNHDGSLAGSELTGFALWNDNNSDGISDPGEVKPIAEHGISALSTTGEKHISGIPFSPVGATLTDGSTRPTYDLILESK